MVDNLQRKGPEDPRTINLSQEWEVKYWSQKYGITEEQLREIVKQVGSSRSKVEFYLNLLSKDDR